MINKQDFKKIKDHMERYDEKNEEIIRDSRFIVKLSKLIINALHRNDLNSAEQNIIEINKKIRAMNKKTSKFSALRYSGSYKVALQEYVEAIAFYHYIKHKKLPSLKELEVEPEVFVAGTCDLTGELVRKAINSVTKENYRVAVEIKDFIENIYSQFLEINFKGELRRKFDSIKYDLKKLEDIVYELKVRDKI